MKEQSKSAVLPTLPIVGNLRLTTKDGKSLSAVEVVTFNSDTELSPFFRLCYQKFKSYLTGRTRTIELELDESELTPFQRSVLAVMKEVPFGEVMSYKDLADTLNTRAYQAIGGACGRNPFLLIYPCHRIVGTRNPGGFAHGLRMKKELLRLEGVSL